MRVWQRVIYHWILDKEYTSKEKEVDVGHTGDELLQVFGQNPKGFFDQNKDPSLWEKESKVSCDTHI